MLPLISFVLLHASSTGLPKQIKWPLNGHQLAIKRDSHLTSEASSRLPEQWNGLAADVARGSKKFSTSLHLKSALNKNPFRFWDILTPSLSMREDWSMLFWCLKAEKGGFTPALQHLDFKEATGFAVIINTHVNAHLTHRSTGFFIHCSSKV